MEKNVVRKKIKIFSGRLSLLWILLSLGCTAQDLQWVGSSSNISGKLSGYNTTASFGMQSAANTALSCASPQAHLYKMNTLGERVEPALATVTLTADGSYAFSIKDLSGLTLVKNTPTEPLVVVIKGCTSGVYFRPITGFKEQNVSMGSSLVSYLLNTTEKDKLSTAIKTDPTSLEALINSLSGASNLSDAYSTLLSTAATSKFTDLFGVAPSVLDSAWPEVVASDLPSTGLEQAALPMSVSVTHWSTSYSAAYAWKLDGLLIGQSSSFSYTPSGNLQGSHSLTLIVGANNGSGGVDMTKPYKSIAQTLVIANNVLPTPPSFAISTPAVTGTIPINTRSLTLTISTGTSKVNCDSFSKLLVTENVSTAPGATDFGSLTCTSAGTQTVAYNLTTAGDGAKNLRLWALDASGVVSSISSDATVYLDMGIPTVNITTTPSALTNATTQSFAFTGDDNGGVIDHFECKLDGAAYAACSTPMSLSGLAQGSHTFSVKAIDTAGNSSTVASKTWTVDLTAPVLTLSGNPSAITNQLSSTFAFSATDSGGGTVAGYECKLSSGAWAACSSPHVEILTAGSYTFNIRATDTAGNVSTVSSYSWVIDTTAPTVSISSKPLAITNSTTGTFTFLGSDTGGGSIAGYQCKLDAGSFASCTSGQSYSSLAAGSHTFEVKATDTAGNAGTAAFYAWTVDLTTPLASINVSPNSITNSTSATFEFSANPPSGGSITGYMCSINGGTYVSCSSPKTYAGLVQGSQTFNVKSVDNNSALSAAASYAWVIDTTLPVLTLATQPSSPTNANSAGFTFSATDAGGGTVAGYECKLNSASFASCSSPVNLTSLTEGSYTYQIRALDTAGNSSAVSSITWLVDTTAPTLSISAKPALITNNQTAGFTFSGADTGGSSLAAYECSLDAAAYASCASPKSYSSLVAGAHSISIRVSDTAGNVSAVTAYDWTIDLTAPTLSITSNPASVANATTASFSFSGSDSGGGSIDHYECKLDSASYTACTTGQAYNSLTATSHTFSVKALDTAGNESAVSSYTWTVDTTPPTIAITTPSANGTFIPATQVSIFTVGGTCSENTRSVQLAGASTATATCSSGTWSVSINVSAVSDGTLSLTATHIDVAGNSTTSAARTFIKDTTNPVINVTTPSPMKGGDTNGSVSWSLTEANVGSGAAFTLELYNGTTWVSLGTKSATVGNNSAVGYVMTGLTIPSLDISTARIRITLVDAAGNSTTSNSSDFIIDSTAPSISSIVLNDNATVALSAALNVKLDGTDNLSGVKYVRIADATGSNCQTSYQNNNWQSFISGGGVQSFSYVTGFANGTKKVCAWVKDAAGNVSQITANSAAGTVGVNTASIRLDQGSPPVFTSLTVTNGNSSSANFGSATFASGDAVTVTFTVTDDSALATNPVSIAYTTDNNNFTEVASYSAVGSPGAAQTTWTKTYTGITAPSSSYFKLRATALDANGNTTSVGSTPLNTFKWSVFAGNSDIGNGASALSARLNLTAVDNVKNPVVVNSNNVTFVSTREGIRRIDPTTGNITSYILCSAQVGVPGAIVSTTAISNCTADLAMDGNDLYIRSGNQIYLVDTINNTIKIFAGTGTSISTADPAQLQIWATAAAIVVDPVTKDLYMVNTCDATFTGNSSSTSTYKIQKITQNPATKTATAVSDFAGSCTKGTPTNGATAATAPLENGFYNGAHGSLIYVPSLNTLYFSPYAGRLIKFANGKVYVSSSLVTTNLRGGIYIPTQNKVYYSLPGYGVYSFTPNSNAAFDEVITRDIADEAYCVISNCRDDGVTLSSAGVYTGALFTIGGQLGVVDNSANAALVARLRVVDAATNSLQTLAGTDRFTGAGGGRTLARFSNAYDLVYKSASSGGFSAGVYISDPGSSRVLYADPSQSNIYFAAGTGISRNTDLNVPFGVSNGISSVGASGNIYSLTLNELGNFAFSGMGIYSVNASGNVIGLMPFNTTSTLASIAPEGANSINYLPSGETYSGMVVDALGNIYFGGYLFATSGGSGYNRIKVRKADGTLYTVVGTNTISVSADCATAGCATTQNIYTSTSGSPALGANRLGRPYDERFNAGEGRLLFSEGAKIRSVSKAYDKDNSKLGTLKTQAGVAISVGRTIGQFVFSYVGATEQIDKVYYASGGSLYCYKVSSGADASCDNTSLGPGLGLNGLKDWVLMMDPNGNVYGVSTSNVVYKYTP